MDGIQIVFLVIAVATILWLLSKAVFAAYFREREAYLKRLLEEWKGKK